MAKTVGQINLRTRNQKFYLGYTTFEMPRRYPVKDAEQANEHANFKFLGDALSSMYIFGSHQHMTGVMCGTHWYTGVKKNICMRLMVSRRKGTKNSSWRINIILDLMD